MTESAKTMMFAVVLIVIFLAIMAFVFGLGVVHGRDEYKTELYRQIEENNRLLKENIELIDRLNDALCNGGS